MTARLILLIAAAVIAVIVVAGVQVGDLAELKLLAIGVLLLAVAAVTP